MALKFNDATDENGFCQEIDDICNTTATSYSLKKKARRLNNALDQYFQVSMHAGNWSVGDTNATDLPFATTNLVQNQNEYGLAVSMLIIESVWILVAGVWKKLEAGLVNVNTTTTGIPTCYAKSERSIIFNKLFDYSVAAGIKVFYQRPLPRFVAGDTSKTAGTPGIHDFYLCRVASLPYLISKSLKNKNDIASEITKDEILINKFYSFRQRDVKGRLKANVESTK